MKARYYFIIWDAQVRRAMIKRLRSDDFACAPKTRVGHIVVGLSLLLLAIVAYGAAAVMTGDQS